MFTSNGIAVPDYPFREEILTPLGQLLQVYTEMHSKTLAVRFDLHFPSDYPIVSANNYISETIAYIAKKYKRQGLDPMYFWVMEQGVSLHQHYHVLLLLNGEKVRSYSHVFHNAEAAWGRILGVNVSGCVHHCNVTDGQVDMSRNGLSIRRCDGPEKMQEQMQNVYNQISYMAKADTKAEDNDGLRNFGMSRFPKQNKE